MADIVIRGMKMPATCWNCKLKVGFSACGLVTDHKDGGFFYRVHNGNSRPDWCPLVPLPEGYGRLIDAHEIYSKLFDEYRGAISDSQLYVHEVLGMIEEADTIIEAEGGGEGGKV